MSCRFSTCLLLWQGKEVVYSWNSPTCAWHRMWPKWRQKAILTAQFRIRDIAFRNHVPRSEKRWTGVLGFLGMKRWRLRCNDTRGCFVKTTRPAAFLAEMAPPRICRHTGEAKEQVHLNLTDADSRLQSPRNLGPSRPPSLTANTSGAQCSQIVNEQARDT